MLRMLPPAGAPLKVSQILRALRLRSDEEDREGLEISVRRYLTVRHVFSFSSGRAALWAILKGLHRLQPTRHLVAVPAYICFSVPASVVRAGLKLQPIDINPETLDFDFGQLQTLPESDVLCIVASNLFGLVNDIPRAQAISRAKGAFLIDNAAQALGARSFEKPAGTGGDVGLYSLGRGKALTTLGGGLAVTNSDEIAAAIGAAGNGLCSPSPFLNLRLFASMLAYSILLNPRLYWIPNSLPFLKLGVTEFMPEFQISRLSAIGHRLLPDLLGDLDELNRIRRRNASVLMEGLKGSGRFSLPASAPDSYAIYTRLPLIADSEETRRRALERLRAAGIGASAFYPSAICDIPGIERHMAWSEFHQPNAESVARRLLTLPTHPLVSSRDLECMAEILRSV